MCIETLEKELGKDDNIFATIELLNVLKVLTYRSLMRVLVLSHIRLVNESSCIMSCEQQKFWLLMVSLVLPIFVRCAFPIRTLTRGK